MTPTIQSRVMHHAHIIYQAGGYNWSEALQAAWDLYNMRLWLAHGVIEFTYRKQDGSTRTARGTNCTTTIPPSKAPTGTQQQLIDAGLAQPNYHSIAYYDLDKEDWRAFSVENFISLDRVLMATTITP